MNKSKLLKLLAMFLTIGVVAAACGSDSDGDDAPPATTAAAAAATTAAPTTTAELEAVPGGSLLDTAPARRTLHCGVTCSAGASAETQPHAPATGTRRADPKVDSMAAAVIAEGYLGGATPVAP